MAHEVYYSTLLKQLLLLKTNVLIYWMSCDDADWLQLLVVL